MFVIGRVEGLFNIYTSLGCAIGTMHTAEKLAEHAARVAMKTPSICREMEKGGEEGEEREKECYV